jgi:hypothetical protein
MTVKPHEVFNSKNRAVKTITTDFKKPGVEKPIQVEWEVKPLSPRLMVKNYKNFAALDQAQAANLSIEEQAGMMQKLAPLIDVILPECCVNPKIVFEGETKKGEVHIDDLDLETLIKLFSGIFEASGIIQPEDDQDLQKVPSPKTLPPSVSDISQDISLTNSSDTKSTA